MRRIWIFLLSLSLFLVIWSFWPAEKIDVQQSLKYPVEEASVVNCDLLEDFLAHDIHWRYPSYLNKSEMARMTITFESQNKDARDYGEDGKGAACTMTVQAVMNMPFAEIYPAQSAIEPFTGLERQSFIFEIIPNRERQYIQGDLLISVNVLEAETDREEHFLIHVVPIEIKVRSLAGIPPHLVRVFGLALPSLLFLIRMINDRFER